MDQTEIHREERIEGYLLSDIKACLATKEDFFIWAFRENKKSVISINRQLYFKFTGWLIENYG